MGFLLLFILSILCENVRSSTFCATASLREFFFFALTIFRLLVATGFFRVTWVLLLLVFGCFFFMFMIMIIYSTIYTANKIWYKSWHYRGCYCQFSASVKNLHNRCETASVSDYEISE